jgi:hypothetical protein
MRSLLPWLLLLVLPACGLIEQVAATRVVAGTVLFVPPIEIAQFPGLTGQVRSQVRVYYGDRPTDGGSKLQPISGGELKLVYPLAPQGLPLREETVVAEDPAVPDAEKPPSPKPGFYVLDIARAGVKLLPHEEYRVIATDSGEEFKMAVTAPEGPSDAEAVKTDPIEHGVDQPLELKHPGADRLAFVLVRWAPDPERPDCERPRKLETFSTLPKTGKDALDLAENDQRWRQDPIVIPGTAFPNCGIYAVVVAGMSRGSAASGNLFIGSQLFAGKATGQVYKVR